MLAQTLFLVAMVAIVAASAVAGIAGTARAQNAAAAKALIVPGVETALGRYLRYVAATIGAQVAAPPGAFAAPPAEIGALNAATVWSAQQYLEAPAAASPLRIGVDIVPTAQTVPACDAADSGPDAAVELQCSAFVQESRLALTVVSDVGPLDANGTVSPLAHGRYTVTLRLFAQAPYAIVSGVTDAADPAGYHEGDDAGWDGALPAFASPAPDDTTIHVVYACVAGTGSCATSNPAPQDAPTTLPWTNGNGLP
ncbi:MAG TPA: hypothetical protein VGP41_09225 [Candidatus Lustribacter sp.]|nr:hypothetical protein [Candidatus Lustribacter sp.]